MLDRFKFRVMPVRSVIRMDEKITVDELTEFLNQFRGDYVVKIIDEKQ